MTGWSTLKKLIWLRIIKGGGSALRTVTGAIVHVTNALAMPAKALSVNVEPIQAGTGDPSPDNVRPISGRTSATVTRTGQNMLNPNDCVDDLYSAVNSMTFQRISGASVYYAFVKPNTTYSLSADKGDRTVVCSCDAIPANNDAIKRVIVNKSTFALPVTFTTAADETIIGIYVNRTAEAKPTQIQLELGSTASAYEPYAGNTYTIQLGDTVYGGQLDVTNGKMLVNFISILLDGTTGKKFVYRYPDKAVFQHTLSIAGKAVSANDISKTICNRLKTLTDNQVQSDIQDGISITRTGEHIKVCLHTVQPNDLTEANDWLAANPLQVVYELATPFEITLTPAQIDMLLGENNLWSDAGDSTLTYYAEGEASTSEALGILLGGTYNNPGGADDVSDDEALGILLGGS